MTLRAASVIALVTVGLGLGVVSVVSAAAPAWACSCAVANTDEFADLIVVGTITEVGERGVRLAVDSVEKGIADEGTTLSLKVGRNEASCGYLFSRGVRYRVPSREGATGLCSGIRQVSGGPAPAVASATADESAGPGESWGDARLAAAAATSAAVVAGLVVVGRRRGRFKEHKAAG